ncbi:MAG: hypothetical protein H6959_10425 [Chromatiaceae bacterium]|nr:hypothetical protein [Chromatiaceae bacterium]MCP5423323.1 hypothetical protein [Chromatiaceae bacterium]
MLMIEHRDTGWRYWLVTVILLTAGIAGWRWGFVAAIALTVVHLLHFLWREGSFASFPVQVRTGYLLLLLASLPGPMQWLYWVPTIGTWAQVIFGYCAMARIVSLMPWNKREPYAWRLFWRTFTARPVRGNILQGLPPAPPFG